MEIQEGWGAWEGGLGPSRCVWARESTAPAQGNQSLSRELRASALCPGLDEYFGHLIRRADSLEKTLMLGKTEGRRRRG